MSFESLKDDLKNPEVRVNGLQSSYVGCYEFGDFRLDAVKRLLFGAGVVVPLTPKAFEVLLLLVSRHGQVVSKDELMSRVWPDTIVEENNLNVNVSLLRKTLGEKPNDHQFIVTVPGSGYQFVAKVQFVGGENNGALARRPKASNSYVSQPWHRVIADEAEVPTDKAIECPTSSIPLPVSEINRHKTEAVVVLAAFIFVVAGISLAWWYLSRPDVKPPPPLQTMKIARLTSNGKANLAVISPDGRWVVHVKDDAGQQSLWMRQVATSGNVQIASPADVDYEGLTFSPDGNYIFFQMWNKKSLSSLYRMPVTGGAARKLVEDIDSEITFSPDGEQFAFLRGDPPLGESALVVAKVDGTAERKLAVQKDPDMFTAAPAWSPDGEVIVCPVQSVDTGGPYMKVVAVQVADGTVRPFNSQRWWKVGQLAWLGDGSGLVMASTEQTGGPSQLWHLSPSGDELYRITNDLADYRGVSVTADSKALVTVQVQRHSNVWIVPSGESNRATQVTFSNLDGSDGISWTSNNRIVYASSASGNSDLWAVDADGSNPKQLTSDARNNIRPVVSPDGRYIVFGSNRIGTNHIWRIDIDGGNPKQLTDGANETSPDCSADSKWVVFTGGPHHEIWKVSIEGGEPIRLSDRFAGGPSVSPDGNLIAAFVWHQGAGRTALFSFGGGPPVKILDIWNGVRWTPDGQALSYIDKGNPSNITLRRIDGGPPKSLTAFRADRIFNFALSRDGKQLALARGTLTNDVVLIRDFKDRR